MNRLGLTLEQARTFAEENALTGALTPILAMSHLACADEPLNSMNQRQLELFRQVRTIFSGVEASLANSAGIFRGADYHFELTRPGIALYGGAAVEGVDNPMRPVVTAEARILQIRRAKTGQSVGYGAATRLARDSVIAITAAGYADGYMRASGAGVPLRDARTQGAAGFLHGMEVPLVGRISMDLSAFDVTDVDPELLAVGDYVELFGPNMPIDRVARAAGTISYELLTGLGRRFHRTYLGVE
jgi:alanine racemase